MKETSKNPIRVGWVDGSRQMWHMHDGWGWWAVFGWIWMIVFWGLIIWAVYAIVRRLEGDGRGADRTEPTALEILERRYARGEITGDEFAEMRRTLGSGDVSRTKPA